MKTTAAAPSHLAFLTLAVETSNLGQAACATLRVLEVGQSGAQCLPAPSMGNEWAYQLMMPFSLSAKLLSRLPGWKLQGVAASVLTSRILSVLWAGWPGKL